MHYSVGICDTEHVAVVCADEGLCVVHARIYLYMLLLTLHDTRPFTARIQTHSRNPPHISTCSSVLVDALCRGRASRHISRISTRARAIVVCRCVRWRVDGIITPFACRVVYNKGMLLACALYTSHSIYSWNEELMAMAYCNAVL